MKTRQLTEDCIPIVKECKGCDRVFSISDGTEYCLAYKNPALFWKNMKEEESNKNVVLGKGSILDSHIEMEAVIASKVRVVQQKQKRIKH